MGNLNTALTWMSLKVIWYLKKGLEINVSIKKDKEYLL